MEFDAFSSELGRGQGRTPSGTTGRAHVFALGDSIGGRMAELSPGDFAEVAQDVDVTDIDFVRAWLRLRVPDEVPEGVQWVVAITVDDRVVARGSARAGETRELTDLAGNVSKLVGTHRIAVRLELVRA